MLKFNAKEWHSAKKHSVPVNGNTVLDVHISCTEPVIVEVVKEDGEVVQIATLTGTVKERVSVTGALSIELKSKAEFGFRIHQVDRRLDEYRDERKPVEKAPPSNILQMLRRRASEEMFNARENFGRGYEIDDDDTRLIDEIIDEAERQVESKDQVKDHLVDENKEEQKEKSDDKQKDESSDADPKRLAAE